MAWFGWGKSKAEACRPLGIPTDRFTPSMIGPISQPVGAVGVAAGVGAGVGVGVMVAMGAAAGDASTTGVWLDEAGIPLPPPPPQPASERTRTTAGFAISPIWLGTL